MEVIELTFPGVKKLRSPIFSDERGFFREMFREPLYLENGICCRFVQDNHSFSKKGTIRGMHFQRSPGQSKLVTVISGEIFDVFVDVREDSPNFGKWEGVYLSASSGDQLFIPDGYAHGFCVVSEEAHVFYKVSSLYDLKEEMSFRYDDPEVGIVWPVNTPILSERDKKSPCLKEIFQGVKR